MTINALFEVNGNILYKMHIKIRINNFFLEQIVRF